MSVDAYTSTTRSESPWAFDWKTGDWTLHDNSLKYILRITKDLNLIDDGHIIIKE